MVRAPKIQAALDAALASLAEQADQDMELVLSEMNDEGQVTIEGTVDLVALVLAVLAHD